MSKALQSAQDAINAKLAALHKPKKRKSLSEADKEKARDFLDLIKCAVATHGEDDEDSKAMDKAEIEGFNVLARWLGVGEHK